MNSRFKIIADEALQTSDLTSEEERRKLFRQRWEMCHMFQGGAAAQAGLMVHKPVFEVIASWVAMIAIVIGIIAVVVRLRGRSSRRD